MAPPVLADDAPPANPDIAPIKLSDDTVENHDAAKTLDLKPLYLSSRIETWSAKALSEEPAYDQVISLQDALAYTFVHGLALKISKESYNYQRDNLIANIAGALPNFGMSYSLSRHNIFSADTRSIARSFVVGLSYPVFQGGSTLYSILAQRHREKAWGYAYKATASDVVLDVYTKYMNLLLARVLLQVRAKVVEADLQLLAVNEAAFKAGTGTKFSILQAQTQLAADKQLLLQQQVAVRQAALGLNFSLNYPMSVNLIPEEETVSEAPLFDENVSLNTLIQDALRFSPMLRQYENFRLAALRTEQLAASSLYPTVSFFTLYQQNDTGVTPAQNVEAVGGIASAAVASSLNSTFAGRASNLALGQQQAFDPTSGLTETQGANTGPSAMPAASGGTPIAAIQSGSLVTSGAAAPSIFGGGSGGGGANTNGSFQAPAGVFPGVFRSFQTGFSLSWSLPSFGVPSMAQIAAVRSLARIALIQCNQALGVVLQNVRSDYLAWLSARRVIDQTAYQVASSAEAWRLARLRLSHGVGTYLEVIQAQSNYITAVTAQAQAIINSNIAQAQLLHDMGMLSVETLTRGYRPGVFSDPTKLKRL